MTSEQATPAYPTTDNSIEIGEVLRDLGRISDEQFELAREVHLRDGRPLAEIVVEQRAATPTDVVSALSLVLNVPLIDLKRHQVNPDVLRLVPEQTARKYNIVPLDIVGDRLIVVMEDPRDVGAIEDVGAQSELPVQTAIGIPSDIQEAIDLNYRASAQIEQHILEFAPEADSTENAVDADAAENIVAQAAIVRALDLIITQAVRDRASDIHIEPQENYVRIRYRVDGILRDSTTVPSGTLTPLISRLKILAGMDITEHRKPQDGQLSVSIDGRDVDIRAATLETSYGETAVLRILDKPESLFNLGRLGILDEVLQNYRKMLEGSFGMLLISGPTGSGKTTSLYASINQLDRVEKSIMTIEDPIEYRFQDIKQVQVNARAGVTFPNTLRAMMRLDPDVILVGEIRDDETAKTAIQAALTGHLVLSSIHANDAPSVVFRLQNLGVEPYLISSVILGVVAQRMLRRVCIHCSVPYEPTEAEMSAYNQEFVGEEIPDPTFSKGAGCNFCSNTGYLDRIGAFEIMPFSSDIRRMVQVGSSVVDLREQAVKEGMVTMRKDGMLKARRGVTTPSEVMRNVFSVG